MIQNFSLVQNIKVLVKPQIAKRMEAEGGWFQTKNLSKTQPHSKSMNMIVHPLVSQRNFNEETNFSTLNSSQKIPRKQWVYIIAGRRFPQPETVLVGTDAPTPAIMAHQLVGFNQRYIECIRQFRKYNKLYSLICIQIFVPCDQ